MGTEIPKHNLFGKHGGSVKKTVERAAGGKTTTTVWNCDNKGSCTEVQKTVNL